MTGKQSRFVAEYLVDLNGKQAAIRAGYAPKTAEVAASKLLSKGKVAQAIAEAMKRRQERVEVKQDDVLRELLRIARTDIGEAFNTDGTLKPLHEMPEDVRRAIASIEVETLHVKGEADDGPFDRGTARVAKIRFWDKTRGLEMLGRHLKLFTDKVEHSGTLTLDQLVPKRKAGAV